MSEQYVVTVVLEGNVDSMSKSMDNAASSQRNVKRATDDANLSFIAQIAKYQAMTAALNQTIGGFNKLAGGMDRLGFKEQAAALRKFTAYLEIIAGPAEIYLAYLTLTIAFGKKDVAVKGAQTTATGGLTLATKALTKAMMANPFMAGGRAYYAYNCADGLRWAYQKGNRCTNAFGIDIPEITRCGRGSI